jgi:RNA polymerase sigma-70 factor (ECF subfamily)
MSRRRFEEAVMPHLNAAFNYARWLTRNDAEAEDVVQEACLRALRFLSSLREGDARPWLFAIVRNTWYSQASRAANAAPAAPPVVDPADDTLDPEQRLLQRDTVARVRAALEQLPIEFREVVLLREIEGLSYKDIAEAVHVPIGTVMSRLSRGRDRLLELLEADVRTEVLR